MNFNNTGKPKNLKIKIDKYKRTSVEFHKYGKSSYHTIGQLVANAFIPNPNNLPFVIHINGDTTQNTVDNLKWSTGKERAELYIFSKIDKNISYKNKKFKTEAEMSRYFGIDPDIYRHRKMYNWNIEDRLTIPVDKDKKNFCGKPLYYKYHDKLMTLAQISKKTGIPKSLIQARLYLGWNIYEASEIPIERKRRV